MPQLDIYSFYVFAVNVSIAFIVFYYLGLNRFLLTIFFDLNLLKLKNFIEKIFFNKLVKGLFIMHNSVVLYSWRLLLVLSLFVLELQEDIFFGNLLDMYSLEIKLVYVYVLHYRWHSFRFKKNNIELTRILS